MPTLHSLWAYTSVSAGRVPGLGLLGWTACVQLSLLNEVAPVDTEPNDFVPGPYGYQLFINYIVVHLMLRRKRICKQLKDLVLTLMYVIQ